MTIISTTVGRNPSEEMEYHHGQQESEMQYLDAISKMTEWFLFISKASIQDHSNPSLCPASNAEEAEVEQFYEDLQDLLELTPKKHVLFIIGEWNAKVGSKDTWSNGQIWP